MIYRSAILVVIIFVLWQLFVTIFQLPNYIVPSPVEVFRSFGQNYTLILSNLWPTILETIIGLFLGVFFGALLAILMRLWSPMAFWLLPLLVVSQALPTFAFAPVLVLWFGYGLLSKIITIAIMLFFPVASSLYDGLKRTPQEWLDVAKTMNGKKMPILWHLQLPSAFPQFASGIRIATVLAPLGAIVSEWVGASKGLGFLMLNANARLDIALLFACLIVITIWSLVLFGVVNALLRRPAT